MRLVVATVIVSVLSLGLTMPVPVGAEELQLSKVYRDYPGYFNPAVCEKPNADQPAAPGEPKMVATAAGEPRQGEPVSDRFAYLGVRAGVVVTQDADADPDIDVSFDAGYGIGVAAGYDFGPARLEIEAGYGESDIDKVTVNGSKIDSDGTLKVQTFMVNGFADFRTGGNLTPYLGAGIGCANIDLDDDDDTVLAGQLAAGVLIDVNPAVAVDLGYRFMITDDPEIDNSEYEVRQHTAMLGLQFRF
jgi:opacity protein-like surface antigen